MAQSQIALRAWALRPCQNIHAARCNGFFPLTPALSLGERVNLSLRGEQSTALGLPLRDARCSLSLRERVRLRGTGAAHHPAYRTVPGDLELSESYGRAGGFPRLDYYETLRVSQAENLTAMRHVFREASNVTKNFRYVENLNSRGDTLGSWTEGSHLCGGAALPVVCAGVSHARECRAKRRLVHAFVALALFVLAGCKKPATTTALPAAPPESLAIFYTCDTRGHIDPCGCSSGMAGGIARRKTFLDAHRAGPHLLVDAGDLTAGPREWELLEFEYLLKGYEQMGYDAVNAGHREAALGLERLLKAKAACGKLVSANLVNEKGEPVLAPYRIVARPGSGAVGIIGVVDDKVSGMELGKGLKILPPLDAIARYLPELKRQTAFIVLLAFT